MKIVQALLGGAFFMFAVSCHSGEGRTSSQTNWLRLCDANSECGEYSCICGVCTVPCSNALDCGGLQGASCIEASDEGVVAACDGQPSKQAMCMLSCDDTDCPEGSSCLAGVCLQDAEATAKLSIDPSVKHQALIGFGASLAYDERLIVEHGLKSEIYDAMFKDSGFDFVRLRNSYENGAANDFAQVTEILSEAETRLGHAPLLYMSSGSPPAELKANGERYCSDSDVDCTLARNVGGDFDYAAFGEFWRASLEAYAAVGVVPRYVSIQSNVDWIPPDATATEACRFLSEEGTSTVTLPDGSQVEAEFPGYDQAIAATAAALSSLSEQYRFSGPETGSAVMVGSYASSVSDVDALAYHFYGMNPASVAIDQLQTISALSESGGQQSIQSEMRASGYDTAVLTHYALTVAGSSGYLQQSFIGQTLDDEASPFLIAVSDSVLQKTPAYYALAHFARYTESGWSRVEVSGDDDAVLSSAWLSPTGDAVTIVVINSGSEASSVKLSGDSAINALLSEASVLRTVFDGVERSASLGQLAESRVVRVPGRSMVTVTSLQAN